MSYVYTYADLHDRFSEMDLRDNWRRIRNIICLLSFAQNYSIKSTFDKIQELKKKCASDFSWKSPIEGLWIYFN